MIITRTYSNGTKRKFNVISAQYADETNLCMMLQTVDDGAVIISAVDNPDLWLQMTESDFEIQPFIPEG